MFVHILLNSRTVQAVLELLQYGSFINAVRFRTSGGSCRQLISIVTKSLMLTLFEFADPTLDDVCWRCISIAYVERAQ